MVGLSEIWTGYSANAPAHIGALLVHNLRYILDSKLDERKDYGKGEEFSEGKRAEEGSS